MKTSPIIARDKRCHQLLMLELRYDKIQKEYRGILSHNLDSVVTLSEIYNCSTIEWDKVIQSIPKIEK